MPSCTLKPQRRKYPRPQRHVMQRVEVNGRPAGKIDGTDKFGWRAQTIAGQHLGFYPDKTSALKAIARHLRGAV